MKLSESSNENTMVEPVSAQQQEKQVITLGLMNNVEKWLKENEIAMGKA